MTKTNSAKPTNFHNSEEKPSLFNQLGWIVNALIFVFTLLLLILIGEVLARTTLSSDRYGMNADIQSPSHLKPKFDQIAADVATGKNVIVLIGDSLWFGATMGEHGDQEWRRHTLDKQLTEAISNRFTATNSNHISALSPSIINLSYNGMLPHEMQILSQHVRTLGAQGVIIDIALRSVSQDFQSPNDVSRSWLRELEVTPDGAISYNRQDKRDDILHRISHGISNFLINNLSLFGWRAQLRQEFFGGNPSAWSTKFATGWKGTNNAPLSQAMALLKTKKRYQSASFNPNQNVQSQALMEIFSMADENFSVLAVYAELNPAIYQRVVEPKTLEKERANLAKMIQTAQNSYLGFIPKIQGLEGTMFLDLVHVNKDGYRFYSNAIIPFIE